MALSALTQDQLDYFEAFGFLALPAALAAGDIDELRVAFDAACRQALGRAPAAGESIHLSPFVEHSPRLLELIDHDALYGALAQLLGDDFIWCSSEGNGGVQGSPRAHHWHADRKGAAELGYRRIKAMLYLEPMTRANGALRVIPGSHRAPLHEALIPFEVRHAEQAPTFFGVAGEQIPAHVIETQPGDVILFDQCLYHAVYFTEAPIRRYVALKYAARPRSYLQVASLMKYSPIALAPEPAVLAATRPRVQRMIEGMTELTELAKLPPDTANWLARNT